MKTPYDEPAIDVDYPADFGPAVDFTFAYQPIVDIRTRDSIAYEALVRGPGNQSAFHIFSQVKPENLYIFDRECRVYAIALAARLGLACDLNLNLLPKSLYSAKDNILSTIEAAHQNNIALERIVLEVTEGEVIGDQSRFNELVNEYRSMGLRVAIDDFGAGYSGLNLLADFQPEQLKLDKELVRGIPGRGPRQAIVRAIVQVCCDLGIDLIAEGVEDADEYTWLCDEGVHLFQGYFFARPGFECLPAAQFP